MLKEYSFVLDKKGQKLDPTLIQNAWRLIRQKKARLLSKFPMVIQLNKVIENPNKDEIRLGIDDGAVHVGIALVQKCLTKNKVLFKGVIEQRKDVHKLMEQRKGYRGYRRHHKWYRPIRFNNRSSSKRKGRYVTALYPELNKLNFQSKTKHCKKVNAKKCKLLWKFNKIYWLKCV